MSNPTSIHLIVGSSTMTSEHISLQDGQQNTPLPADSLTQLQNVDSTPQANQDVLVANTTTREASGTGVRMGVGVASSSGIEEKNKTHKLKSKVWASGRFKRIVLPSGNILGKCLFCGREFKADSKKYGTRGMLNHMEVCKRQNRIDEFGQTEINFKYGNDGEGGRIALSTYRYDHDAVRKAITYMIINDELPFKFVESKGFKHLMFVACPRFRMPSRFTIARDCFQLYVDEKKNLRQYLKVHCPRVCLTTDTWTSNQRINYMSLTAHFINNDWKLQKKILNFCPIGSHKGEKIAAAIEKCLTEWGISNVFSVTMDNASSNDVAIASLRKKFSKWKGNILGSKYIHVRCIAHIINLIVNDGLRCSGRAVYRIRRAVRYVRQSPARFQKFKECVLAEGLVTKALLSLDVPTRWNSTFIMLETACKFESVFERFNDVDDNFKPDLESVDRDRHVDEDWPGLPDQNDWISARKLCVCLANFSDLTAFVSGSSYVTCNAYFDEIMALLRLLNHWMHSGDHDLSLMAQNMKLKFDKYWGEIDKCNMITYIAAILDPRHKFEYIEFSLKQVYGDSLGEIIWDKVKNAMYELFNAYNQLLNPHSYVPQVQQPNNSNVVSASNITDLDNANDEGDRNRRKQFKMEMKSLFKRMRHGDGSFGESKTELERYISEDAEEDIEEFEILTWWKMNAPRFPVLSSMARDILAVPISTVASESSFSSGGRLLDSFRSSLTPKIVQALICSQDWLRAADSPLNFEETMLDIEKLENDLSELAVDQPVEV